MKKLLLTFVSIFICSVVSIAGNNNKVTVSNIRMEQTGGKVDVTFSAKVAGALKGNYTVTITPILENGDNSIRLTPFIIQGRHARLVEQRKYGLMTREPNVVVVSKKDETMQYKTTIDYQSWMANPSLIILEEVREGCCKIIGPKNEVVAERVPLKVNEPAAYVAAAPVTPAVPAPVTTTVAATTGPMSVADKLAEQFPFIVRASELDRLSKKDMPAGMVFDYNMPLNMVGLGTTDAHQQTLDQFILNTRDGSLSIYFPKARRVIERGFRTNSRVLVELVTTIRAIEASSDSRIAKIIIVGAASPEGTLDGNMRLGWDRAVAAKEFILNNTSVKVNVIHLYNGGEDWEGLRRMVAESDMYEKYAILNIIDSYPRWDAVRNVGRLGELMRLNGGAPYRYMSNVFFPDLRNASFIKIYYENK